MLKEYLGIFIGSVVIGAIAVGFYFAFGWLAIAVIAIGQLYDHLKQTYRHPGQTSRAVAKLEMSKLVSNNCRMT